MTAHTHQRAFASIFSLAMPSVVYLTGCCLSFLAAVLAGMLGLATPLEALLQTRAFSEWLGLLFSLGLIGFVFVGTFTAAKHGHPLGSHHASVWMALQIGIFVMSLIPYGGNPSPLVQAWLTAVRVGAGF